jgi:sugar lactone lactonase YvrE
MQIERVADTTCETGEGPLWHPIEKCVYWVDIPRGRLFRYDPSTETHEQVLETEAIGGFTVQADGALLLFMARGAIKIWRTGQFERTIVDDIPAERESRFNDVIADPRGRVFCGTMPGPDRSPGRLYRLDPDGSLRVVLEGVKISNGMGFTTDHRRMYFTDSLTYEISLFDYDEASGDLSNRRVFVHIEGEGIPDGMTVDAEGCVWSARWDGGMVIRYAPDGAEMARIEFPARKVSCATFGGDDYRDMYVTTAGGQNRQKEGAGAGALYRLQPGVAGRPEFLSRIGL